MRLTAIILSTVGMIVLLYALAMGTQGSTTPSGGTTAPASDRTVPIVIGSVALVAGALMLVFGGQGILRSRSLAVRN